MAINRKSIFGRKLGLGDKNQLISNGIEITRPAVDATITIGDEATDARAITIQLKDANGANIDYAEYFEIVMFSSSAMTDFVATGGSTGLAAGASGKLQAIVAKKLFRAISTTAGLWAGTYTDTGSDAGYLAVRLPNGRIVAGGAVTNAA
jgi:dihydrodipicolinate synthase/N-acetylneuraminate lyase